MDFDEMGQINLQNFCDKIGKNKVYPIKQVKSNFEIKDANDVL